MSAARLTGAEVAKHDSADSCWVIVHGKAYDVTDFLPEHPGGQKIILKYAGKDATEAFEPIHPPDTLDKYLDHSKHKGEVDMATVERNEEVYDPEEEERQKQIKNMPPLNQCFNLLDFESVAKKVMKRAGWAYYSSGADDEITMRENHSSFHKIGFRPKILVDVEHVDMSTTMLGQPTSAPFYVTATALGKLGHPEGEVCLTKAAGKHGIIQMIPTLASCSFDEIIDAASNDQIQWLQLYVNKNRDVTKKIVQHAEKRGCKGLFITVDAPQLGRREKDMRSKFHEQGADVQDQDDAAVDRSQGAARAISSFIDPALSWKDIPWFQSITKMPIVIKGVQRVDDVIRAVEAGIDGVVLSNHGGRQLEFAPTAIEILAEVSEELRRRGWQDRIEIYVDGGVRRGTDVMKALCLGAKGVGLGRPFLYAMSAYGEAGVVKAMSLLKDELEMNMRLLGVNKISDLSPDFLDTRSLASRLISPPGDTLSSYVYDPLSAPTSKMSKL
ncbi:Aldolase-type TIM barrel [Ascosphaera apis ARSEF 7405]|uniref:L-lactate dehydrogenase (cytochrome) n=1 Tax=Ascosphaera apis ARSEF 7405 TaxID=392613 RepID=A0A166N888_9EURO|nr:Aldolase-type TIM barrel [Ascosphaera apis ARSEF 7405]